LGNKKSGIVDAGLAITLRQGVVNHESSFRVDACIGLSAEKRLSEGGELDSN